jgi:peptidoglycan/LPS O-acetylase OafA/YrhL
MYFLPPYRFTSFAMGILLAIFLRNNENFKLSKVQRMLGNLMSLACAVMTCVIVVRNVKFNPLSQAYFSAFAPITYCFIFAWFILLARSGSESEGKLKFRWSSINFLVLDFFTKFLEWRFFKLSTNIAFGFYLLQFIVFNFNIATKRSPNMSSIYLTIVRIPRFSIDL